MLRKVKMEEIKKEQQRALIRDKLHSAVLEIQEDGMAIKHPFVLSVEGLRHEIDFFRPFIDQEICSNVVEPYQSAVATLEEAEAMIFSDTDVSPDYNDVIQVVDYHTNILKIHRAVFTKAFDDAPPHPAPPAVQKQASRLFDSLAQLQKILDAITEIPKPPRAKKQSVTVRAVRKQPAEPAEPKESFTSEFRVSPFITDGPDKNTIIVEDYTFPRFM